MFEKFMPKGAASKPRPENLTAELEAISRAHVEISPLANEAVRVTLPHGAQAIAEPSTKDAEAIYLHSLEAGNRPSHEALPIESRLIQAIGRFALEINPEVRRIRSVHVNPDIVVALIEAVGEENITVHTSHREAYGHGQDESLVDLSKSLSKHIDKDYRFYEVVAHLDPAVVALWELPSTTASSS